VSKLLLPHSVPSDDPSQAASIEPTLTSGDHILLSRTGTIKPGYLVRCADPDAPGRFVIARLAGVPGDTIDITGGTVNVNGRHIASPRACSEPTFMMRHPVTLEDLKLRCNVEDSAGTEHEMLYLPERSEATKSIVETGRWYLVSDNRVIHVDSREYGPVDPATCQHVVFRVWGQSGFFDSSRRFTVIW
jgi:signal peptidase I